MKKFILALTAVAVTSLAGAATVGWSLAGAGNYANDAYQIFVIGQNGVASVAALTALLDAGTDVSSYAFGSGAIAANGTANQAATVAGAPTLGEGTYTAFYVIYDSATPAAGSANYAVVSGATGLTQSVGQTTGKITFAAANQANTLNDSSNWQPYGVPEPTTVALLALGLAAVGLKRKLA